MSEAEAAAWGLSVEEASGPPVEIWPDNLECVNLFICLSTQWRVGMSGAYGLDYNVMYAKMNRMGLESDRFDLLEDEMRIMESAALDEIQRKAK